MDQDGANHQLPDRRQRAGADPALLASAAQEITYLSYAGGPPRVYLLNIDTGKQESIGDFPA